MFWKYGALNVSALDSLLDKQGVTLKEILEQEDIIQECKSQNKKLVDYLTRPEILSELLDLILQEPSEELEERLRFKLPNIASEVITCDVPQINEKLSSDSTLLDKLYAFLEAPAPLNPLLTSFFSKAFGVLITRRAEQNWYSYQYTCLQVIQYVKLKPDFTGLLLTHIGTSAVMDLLLRFITCIEGTDNKQSILTWLNEERLIQRVCELLGPPSCASTSTWAVSEQHDNVGQLLVEIIRISRDTLLSASPQERLHNALLAQAESPETVQAVLSHILADTRLESSVVNGVEVLLALLEVRRPAPQGTGFYPYTADPVDQATNRAELERQQAVLESTVSVLVPSLPALTALLTNPAPRAPLHTTAGTLDPPLGRMRLAIAKLFSALLATNHLALNQALMEAETATILLDLFFKYSLNNFLHAQVESCVHSIIFWKQKVGKEGDQDPGEDNLPTPEVHDNSSLQTPKVSETGTEESPVLDTTKDPDDVLHPLSETLFENPALVHLVTSGRIFERLLAAWYPQSPNPAVAYLGHVTRITNNLVSAMGENPDPPCPSKTLLLQVFSKLSEETQEKWKQLIDGKLIEINKLNELKPAVEEKRVLSSDDEDPDFRDIKFPHDPSVQQMQEMSDNFVDSFGFNDDEFNEPEENVNRGMRKLNSVNFLMQTDDSTKQAIFDSVCEQRIKSFNSDEDPWADKTAEISFSRTGGRSVEMSVKENIEDQYSSDEENEPAPDKMEVDVDTDPWETIDSGGGGLGGSVAMDTSSPWGPGPPEGGTSSVTEGAEGGGWATFSDSGGGGAEPGEGGGWHPAYASSPEATMLDCEASSPLPCPPDIADTNANPAPVPSDSQEGVEVKEGGEEALRDNFSFLAARGLIAAQEDSDGKGCDIAEGASETVSEEVPVSATEGISSGVSATSEPPPGTTETTETPT